MIESATCFVARGITSENKVPAEKRSDCSHVLLVFSNICSITFSFSFSLAICRLQLALNNSDILQIGRFPGHYNKAPYPDTGIALGRNTPITESLTHGEKSFSFFCCMPSKSWLYRIGLF